MIYHCHFFAFLVLFCNFASAFPLLRRMTVGAPLDGLATLLLESSDCKGSVVLLRAISFCISIHLLGYPSSCLKRLTWFFSPFSCTAEFLPLTLPPEDLLWGIGPFSSSSDLFAWWLSKPWFLSEESDSLPKRIQSRSCFDLLLSGKRFHGAMARCLGCSYFFRLDCSLCSLTNLSIRSACALSRSGVKGVLCISSISFKQASFHCLWKSLR